MTTTKPESMRVWPLMLACLCIILATVCAVMSAVLTRSWPGFLGSLALGGTILHPVWGKLVDRIAANNG